jgi:hypothetical protein
MISCHYRWLEHVLLFFIQTMWISALPAASTTVSAALVSLTQVTQTSSTQQQLASETRSLGPSSRDIGCRLSWKASGCFLVYLQFCNLLWWVDLSYRLYFIWLFCVAYLWFCFMRWLFPASLWSSCSLLCWDIFGCMIDNAGLIRCCHCWVLHLLKITCHLECLPRKFVVRTWYMSLWRAVWLLCVLFSVMMWMINN